MQVLVDPTLYGGELRVNLAPLTRGSSRPSRGVGGTTLLATLEVGIPPGMTEKAAFENLKAGLKRLETALRTEHAENFRRLMDMLQVFEFKTEEKRVRLRALQHDMPSDPSAKLSEINKVVEDLRGQIRESEIQNVAKEARLTATEDELSKLDGPHIKENPLKTELTKVVGLYEKQLQTIKERVARGDASQDDLEKATLKLTEANVELSRVGMMGWSDPGNRWPELVAKLRGEATTLVIDLKELVARREAAERQLAEAEQQQRELLEARKRFQEWQLGQELETRLMRSELERAQQRMSEVREQLTALEMVQPTVTIVDREKLDGARGDKPQPAPKSR